MRDDFSSKTKEMLAKRVTYLCSNPLCRKPTIGPNSLQDKAISIGVAAHITAAAIGGPRYDSKLSQEDRVDIENGIWLCQNCSVLVDRDQIKFTKELLKEWKIKAEDESYMALMTQQSYNKASTVANRPYAEAELIWTGSGKHPQGPSPKTSELYGNTPISMLQVIWYNHLYWNYDLKIYNNSAVGLFNLKIHQHPSNEWFELKDKVPKINNLPPYQDLILRGEIFTFFEGTGKEAVDLITPQFPDKIQGLRILLEYVGENRNSYYSELTLKERIFEISHLESRPVDYGDF